MAPQRDNAPEAAFDREHDDGRAGPHWAPAAEHIAPRRSRPSHFEPRPPAEIVYPHATAAPSDLDEAYDQLAPTRAMRRVRRAPRGMIPLLWTAMFAGAALMHAAEVDRRIGLREPSPGELQMHDRPTRQIKAAWRSVGDSPVAVSAAPDAQTKTMTVGNAGPPDAAAEATPVQHEQTATVVPAETKVAIEQNTEQAYQPPQELVDPAGNSLDHADNTTKGEIVRDVSTIADTLPQADKPGKLRLHSADQDHSSRSPATWRSPTHRSHTGRRKRSLTARIASANIEFWARYNAAFRVFEYVARRTP